MEDVTVEMSLDLVVFKAEIRQGRCLRGESTQRQCHMHGQGFLKEDGVIGKLSVK